MEDRCEKMNKELEETEQLLVDLKSQLEELRTQKDEQEGTLKELTDIKESMQKKLNAATKLITGLGREKVRWTQERERLSENTRKLIGDCLSCSSFLSYAGPFDYFYRKRMVYEDWRQKILDNEIPCTQEEFKLENLLTS